MTTENEIRIYKSIGKKFFNDSIGINCAISEWNLKNDLNHQNIFYFQAIMKAIFHDFNKVFFGEYCFFILLFIPANTKSQSKKINDYITRHDKVWNALKRRGVNVPQKLLSCKEFEVLDADGIYGYYSLFQLTDDLLTFVYQTNAESKIFACRKKNIESINEKMGELILDAFPSFSVSHDWETMQFGTRYFRDNLLADDAIIFSIQFCLTDLPELSIIGLSKCEIATQLNT